jgi:hypothetical protein
MLFGTVDYFNWGIRGPNEKMPRAGIEMQFFAVLYFLTIFLLVLNFVLAIIVEAYVKLRQDLQEQETEQDFLTDLKDCMHASCLGMYYGWADAGLLGSILEEWTVGILKIQVASRLL